MNGNTIQFARLAFLIVLFVTFTGCDQNNNNTTPEQPAGASGESITSDTARENYVQMEQLDIDINNNEQVLAAIEKAKAQGATAIILNPDNQKPVLAGQSATEQDRTIVHVETDSRE